MINSSQNGHCEFSCQHEVLSLLKRYEGWDVVCVVRGRRIGFGHPMFLRRLMADNVGWVVFVKLLWARSQ